MRFPSRLYFQFGLNQTRAVKNLVRFAAGVFLVGHLIYPAKAAFTSIYIFGDGISTTTNNPLAGSTYYGLRRSNGRVWVEVLAQRQGLGNNSVTNVNWFYSSNNWSYYGDYSSNLVQNVNSFHRPPDAATALFVVWVNNADFVDDMGKIYPSTNIVTWTNAINLSLSNHFKAVTNLYGKGALTLIMPNAVDITEIPEYDGLFISAPADKSFIRQRVVDFNTGFIATLNRARTNCPGLNIYIMDAFTLLDNILAHPANYGVTNALYNGVSVDAQEDPALKDKSMNGPGTNYIFWDAADPTAKVHAVLADVAQQLISPAQITKLTLLNGSNRLDAASIPIGLNGFVDGRTNLVLGGWTSVTNINSTNTTQTIFVPVAGPPQFYRLRFPYAWSWP